MRTLAAAGLTVPEGFVVLRERVEEGGDSIGYEAMQKLLAIDPPPDAVFCYNDLTAVGAAAAVLAAGLRVPEDVAIIGCGNFRYAKYLKVPLSSIDHGTAELGRVAGELALQISANPGAAPQSVLLEPTLVVRRSTGG